MKKIHNLLVAAILLIVSISCSKEDTEPENPKVEHDSASILTYNYFAEKIEIDWYINEKKIEEGQPFAFSNHTTYEWEKGLEIFSTIVNKTSDDSQLAARPISIADDKSYSLLMLGENSNMSIQFLEIDKSQEIDDDSFIVRFTNGSADIAGLDIYVGGSSVDNKVATNIKFSETTDYMQFLVATSDAGIIITNTGVAPNIDTNLLTIGDPGLQESKIYHVIIGPSLSQSSKPHNFYQHEE